MRALALLSVLVVAFLAVRWFYRESRPVVGAAPDGAPAPARFLTPPSKSASTMPPVVPAQAPAKPPPPPAEAEMPVQATPQPAAFPALEKLELEAAAALVHGTPADVQSAAAGLPGPRARLVEACAWALSGEQQLARSLAGKIGKDGIGEREQELLESALSGTAVSQTASGQASPIVRAMEMGLVAREARSRLQARDHAAAARAFSGLLLAELAAPWPADPRALAEWTGGLVDAQSQHRWNPRAEWPGEEVKVESGDTLIGIRKGFLAQHPDVPMCTGLIERSNRIRGYLQPGNVLRIPTEPVRMLVDLDACWAVFLFGDEVAASWPVGVGRPGEETPPGDYLAREKIENPPWMKTGQEMIPFGDPRNPLGTRWIGWYRDGLKTSFGFHGTQAPESIGQASSDGCVRFHNRDIEELFQILPEGAPIEIRP